MAAATDKKDQLSEAVEIVKSLKTDLETMKKAVYHDGASPGKVFATPHDPKESGRCGYKSFGEYLTDVKNHAFTGKVDKRLESLVEKAATGMGEAVGTAGGFLVPPTFSTTVLERVYEDNPLIKMCDQYTTSGNSMTFPANAESSRANGSRFGGVRAYWAEEGLAGTASAPAFRQFEMKLHKLICLARVTEELVQDSVVTLDQYLTKLFAQEIGFVVGDAIVNGTGAGQPQGILNSPALVSVTKETGQAATTLLHENVVKMWARLYAPSQSNAVWLINQDVYPQLYTMTLGVGTGGVTSFMPPGGLSDKPYATLFGRPIYPTEWNPTLGTVGDLLLVDMKQYLLLSKGQMANESSIHLYFDRDETAFRTTYRVDGLGWWQSALTPFKGGSNTQSCFVALATRS